MARQPPESADTVAPEALAATAASGPTSDPALEATAAGDGSAPAAHGPARPSWRGQKLDHFLVIDELGAGGMGVVLAAYDPELDRKVAIKLLHGETGSAEGRTRLQREAQAMAKLAHPNVVTVFEVGVADGRVFIAMEHVDGGTLTG